MFLTLLTAISMSSSFARSPELTWLNVLGRAIGTGDQALFQTTLPKIENIDEEFNPQRETPLTLAAYNDRPEWVHLILARGAHVDHQTTTGYTALMFAAMGIRNATDASRTVRVLLDAHADRGLRNVDGKSALDLARERHLAEIVELLRP